MSYLWNFTAGVPTTTLVGAATVAKDGLEGCGEATDAFAGEDTMQLLLMNQLKKLTSKLIELEAVYQERVK